MADDVYDDPENILSDDDSVDGAAPVLRDDETDEMSQTPFMPEKDTGVPGEDRGAIDELGVQNDPYVDSQDDADAEDVDADRLGGQIPNDERDGTDPA